MILGGQISAPNNTWVRSSTVSRVPATKIHAVYGLVVPERYDLERGAYVAPDDCWSRRFELPDGSEPHAEKIHPHAVVLVRGLEFGPGILEAND